MLRMDAGRQRLVLDVGCLDAVGREIVSLTARCDSSHLCS